jgi:CRISPR/Cas system-associated endonuclease Cas1
VTTKTLDTRKINLIVQISKLDKEESVRQVEEFISLVEKRPTEKQLEMLKKLAKPVREKVDIEELKRQQNWKPVNREEFERLVKEMDIQEPIEQLIADIGK